MGFLSYLHFMVGVCILQGSVHAQGTATAADICAPVPTTTTYDYIVVGSGPGGGPLAARLAMANFSVLLLEAGGDHAEDLTVQIPFLQTQSSEYIPQTWQFFVSHYNNMTQAIMDSKFTWNTTKGEFFVGPNPPAGSSPLGIYYPRAAALGGCAEHNALVTAYPHNVDWDTIANITGDLTWESTNMRQYWERFESNQYIQQGSPGSSGHGYNGWLNISVMDLNLVPMDQKWVSVSAGAAKIAGTGFQLPTNGTALGEVFTLDLNSNTPGRDTLSGIFQIPLAVSKAPRSRTSPRQFLLDTSNAKNPDGSRKYILDIQLNTLVSLVTFNTSSNGKPRATGVQYFTGCNLYQADPKSSIGHITGRGSFTAKREVILAGGVFNTPQLLKLSGIGPPNELKSFGIPVVASSPGVGTNMQDRYEVTVDGFAPDNFAILQNCTFLHAPVLTDDIPPNDPCLVQWQENAANRGIYGTNAVAFGVVQSSSVAAPTAADLFIVGVPADFRGYFPGYSTASDLKHWSWLVLKAHSRNNAGNVTLRSISPFDTPRVNFSSFSVGGDADVQAVFEGVQLARQMFAVSPNLNGTFTEVVPGPNVQTEDQIKQFIRNEAWGHHASCSVPIGKIGDPNAPLDSNFTVQGVDGLRVVDASVFPQIPGFYIAGAVYMISEKAADVITQAASIASPPLSCDAANIQCCTSVLPASDPTVRFILDTFDVIANDNIPIGLSCSPCTTGQTLCCQNNSFNGFFAVDCTPFNK